MATWLEHFAPVRGRDILSLIFISSSASGTLPQAPAQCYFSGLETAFRFF